MSKVHTFIIILFIVMHSIITKYKWNIGIYYVIMVQYKVGNFVRFKTEMLT